MIISERYCVFICLAVIPHSQLLFWISLVVRWIFQEKFSREMSSIKFLIISLLIFLCLLEFIPLGVGRRISYLINWCQIILNIFNIFLFFLTFWDISSVWFSGSLIWAPAISVLPFDSSAECFILMVHYFQRTLLLSNCFFFIAICSQFMKHSLYGCSLLQGN